MFKYVYDRFITGVLALALLAAASATLLVTGCPGGPSFFEGVGNVNGNVEEPVTTHPQDCVEVVNSVPVFLSSDRSILIRDDVDAGHAQLTVTTDKAASSFKWCVQRENPAKAANALLQFDPPLDNDGCVTTATGSQSGGLSGHVNITKVIGDPGPGNAEHDGEQVIITVVATVDDVDANNEPIHCAVPGDAPITLQVRRPDAPLLVAPLQTSAPAGANEVAPRGKITLTAKISGGKPFVPPGLNCPGGDTDSIPVALVPDNNGDPYCVQWTVNETQLSPPPKVALAARAHDGDVKAGSLTPQADGSVIAALTYVAPSPVGTGNVEATIVVSDAKGASFAQTVTIRISAQSLSVAVDAGQSDIQPGGSTHLDAKVAGGTPPYDACWYAASVAGEPGSLTLPTGRKNCSANLDLLQGFSLDVQKELKKFLSLDSAAHAEDKPSFCVCNLSSGVELSSLYTAPAQGSLVQLEVRAIDSVSARATSALVNLNVSAGAGVQCGDGVKQTSEECDTRGDTAQCDRDCTLPKNGDGLVNAAFGEECDDGNTIDTDGCRNNGKLAACGDGVVQRGVEECDNGAANSNASDAACRPDCKKRRCGDGTRDPGAGEECDDGNASSVDDCVGGCKIAKCGDGFLNLVGALPHEQCDPPNAAARCENNCTLRNCGNGVDTDPGEECDDGDFDNTDACLTTCQDACCGDGVVEIGVEECDGGALPGVDCTAAVATAVDTPICNGAAAPASFRCQLSRCGDGYQNAAAGEKCDGTDFDPSAPGTHGVCRNDCTFCGDNIVNGNETCDDGNAVNNDSCRNDCNRCGDGVIQGGEQCDGAATGICVGGCDSSCVCVPLCGDAVVNQASETCDGAAQRAGVACHAICRPTGGPAQCTCCGDNIVNGSETCDDGNAVNNDSCRNDCTRCGDGIIQGGEQCDGAATGTCVGGCDSSCVCVPLCGDAVVNQASETCDGAAQRAGVACNAICRATGSPAQCTCCGDNIVNSSETCDDGNAVNNDSCRNDCTRCGDGIIQGGEQCDGAATGSCVGGCDSSCVCVPLCGDAVVNQASETCDGAAQRAGVACNAICRPTGGPAQCTCCGDNIVNGSETCDDGNAVNNDSCRNDCTRCGDGIIQGGEQCDGAATGSCVGGCASNCTCLPLCGDAVVNQASETCDGPTVGPGVVCNAAGCRAGGPDQCTCCGDAIIQAGEHCDLLVFEPGSPPGRTCQTDCTFCGDTVVDAGEDCDDGDNNDNNGCPNDCTIP